jgi:hypothetical protein
MPREQVATNCPGEEKKLFLIISNDDEKATALDMERNVIAFFDRRDCGASCGKFLKDLAPGTNIPVQRVPDEQ